MSVKNSTEIDYHKIEFLHPASPECIWGSIFFTCDRDALICSNCLTVTSGI